jgi:Leucine-rich repeat (LRR) protein
VSLAVSRPCLEIFFFHIACLIENSGSADVFTRGNRLDSFTRVCKEWCTIGREATTRLIIKCNNFVDIKPDDVDRVTQSFPRAETLCLLDEEDKFFRFSQLADIAISGRVSHLQIRSKYPERSGPVQIPPAIGTWESLQSLSLSGYWRMIELPEEIAKCSRLRSLDLDCGSICLDQQSVFQTLPSLQCLRVRKCVSTQLAEEIGNWEGVKELCLDDCDNLRYLPRSVALWSELSVLELKGLSALTVLPDEVGFWLKLRKISLKHCKDLVALPDSVGGWNDVEDVDFSCTGLRRIPRCAGEWKNLTTLDCSRSWYLSELPQEVIQWGSLRVARFDGCRALSRLPEGVSGWMSLEEIVLANCCLEALPKEVINWRGLRSADLSECQKLRSLPKSIGAWKKLENFSIRKSENVAGDFPKATENWRQLKVVDLTGCKDLSNVGVGMKGWKSIEYVHLDGYEGLITMSTRVCAWTALKTLHLEALEELPAASGAWVNLEDLSISSLKSKSLPRRAVSMWTSLRRLVLGSSMLLALPNTVNAWQNLTEIQLKCPLLELLPGAVGGWTRLQSASFEGCSSLRALPKSVGEWQMVQHLDFSRCIKLRTLPQSVCFWEKVQRMNLV